MPKVIHLVPYDGIGGVETAARSMVNCSANDFEFQVEYIYPPTVGEQGRYGRFHPWPALRAVRRMVKGKPDLLIVSLWRSCIVGLLAKLFNHRLRLVLFLHLPCDAHWLDRLVTRCAAALATEIWADSKETLDQRLPALPHGNGRVISFVTHHVSPLTEKSVSPMFIYWGRLHPRKAIDRSLRIFTAIHDLDSRARFSIIGPDGGDLARLKALAATAGLTGVVSFLGHLDFDAITEHAGSASFYLQTSSIEGMAMSVVEAMQLGLVPVVTPVGEIGNYCRHNENALLVYSDEATVEDISEVLQDEVRYRTLRKNAVASWAAQPLYADSVMEACMSIFDHHSDEAT